MTPLNPCWALFRCPYYNPGGTMALAIIVRTDEEFDWAALVPGIHQALPQRSDRTWNDAK
jgi:hypothetical protein